MPSLSPDFFLWGICLFFGAFCVWQACRIILRLGTTASAVLVGTGSPALQLHIGEWLRIAITSPAVAFFALGVGAGIGLPAYYAYLYRPSGPNGYETVTVYGTFASAEPKVCFQADAVTHSDTGYVIKLPKGTRSVDFAIEPPDMLAATNLMIELDGDAAQYSVDNGAPKLVAIDHQGVIRIPDPIPIGLARPANSLVGQRVTGTQVMTLNQAFRGVTP